MKTFIAKQEIRDLLNKVIMDEVSFTRMVEIMNERVSERVSERVNERVNERVVWRRISPEELKKGDLAIFWDESKKYSLIRFYKKSNGSDEYYQHKDNQGYNWKNAIKFESKEQYERFINGVI